MTKKKHFEIIKPTIPIKRSHLGPQHITIVVQSIEQLKQHYPDYKEEDINDDN